MKKYLKLLFVFLLGFMIIPMVNAADLPREGVTYFLYYPDGHEEATTNYTEATNPQEKLIYSGTTDENGKIQLCGWEEEGVLRVVQHVPDGYTTNAREIKVDLSKRESANFVNYKGLVNPTTSRSLLVLFGIVGVASVTILVSRKNKKSLMIIPVIIGGTLLFTVANALGDCQCVTVKDGTGKTMPGVQIDIYATPIEVDAAPAIKFDANGGNFFDGTTEMYFRIPNDQCSISEFMNSLSEEEQEFLSANMKLAYRDGYYPDGVDKPDTLTNGTVIKLYWTRDNAANLLKINGNGGVINFYGKVINEVYVYSNSERENYIIGLFNNGNYRPVGYDNTSSCSNYNEFGINNNWITEKQDTDYRVIGTEYVCWNNKPDGVYINDILFLGNTDTCYAESYLYPANDSSVYLYSLSGDEIYIGDMNNDDIFFSNITKGGNGYDLTPVKKIRLSQYEDIERIEIVKNGATVLVLTEDDFEIENSNYYIGNDSKREALLDYFAELFNNDCINSGR